MFFQQKQNLRILLVSSVILTLANCFSELRTPPITLTRSLTSAEKQMLGEDKELEKNGWAFASIKSSSTGVEDWKSFQDESLDEKEVSEIKKVLAYSSFEIYNLKKQGVLGESLSGNLEFVNKTNLLDKERIEALVKLTNQARNKLRILQLSLAKKKLNAEEYKTLEQKLKVEYYQTLETGMYFEEIKGNWKRKQ